MAKKQKLRFKYRVNYNTHEVFLNTQDDEIPYCDYFNTKEELSAILKSWGQRKINVGRQLLKMAELKNIVLPK